MSNLRCIGSFFTDELPNHWCQVQSYVLILFLSNEHQIVISFDVYVLNGLDEYWGIEVHQDLRNHLFVFEWHVRHEHDCWAVGRQFPHWCVKCRVAARSPTTSHYVFIIQIQSIRSGTLRTAQCAVYQIILLNIKTIALLNTFEQRIPELLFRAYLIFGGTPAITHLISFGCTRIAALHSVLIAGGTRKWTFLTETVHVNSVALTATMAI